MVDAVKARVMGILEKRGGLLSAMIIENPYRYSPLINGMDLLLLAVSSESAGNEPVIEHWLVDGLRIEVQIVEAALLEQWVVGIQHRSIITWLVRGEILFDQGDQLGPIRERLVSFTEELRKQKLLAEFSSFIRTYMHAKQDLQDGNVLDAHSSIMACLRHWAHIVLIEEGAHPELTVWAQVKLYNPGVYKLYEELTTSSETVEQRVQLVLLACEFHVMSKMKACCGLLLERLHAREEPWTVAELHRDPQLAPLKLDLSLLLQKLVKRGYVREVAYIPDSGDGDSINTDAIELRYAR